MKTIKDIQKEYVKRFGKKFPLAEIKKELDKYVSDGKLKKKKVGKEWYYYEDTTELFSALLRNAEKKRTIRPIAYNCDGCNAVCVEIPERKQYPEGEVFVVPAYCEKCLVEPLNQFFIKVAPLEYEVQQGLDENVAEGNMTRKWDKQRNEWMYGLTPKGRREVENMGKR